MIRSPASSNLASGLAGYRSAAAAPGIRNGCGCRRKDGRTNGRVWMGVGLAGNSRRCHRAGHSEESRGLMAEVFGVLFRLRCRGVFTRSGSQSPRWSSSGERFSTAEERRKTDLSVDGLARGGAQSTGGRSVAQTLAISMYFSANRTSPTPEPASAHKASAFDVPLPVVRVVLVWAAGGMVGAGGRPHQTT
ncbi:ryanodine-inositol 1,4,5-triphosphate receptor Ca2+ channel [Anopheles sinensis]|uniref:Ryanodine-inositol 1,4,5-triphosphate receptor Ca2+ channel n=1 Tax=Anopheles sinensis TaxID=74873 RepID=A0A084VKD2_ANOSI|nr:ryanodine-inositol 1,4,5-triphosphate receptor Ca2+ channel [Anopheles sinensis]